MEIILIALIIFITIVVVGYPLVNARRYALAGMGSAGDEQLENLDGARTTVIDALRDLEFDHLTGKLSDGDYQSLRAQYEVKAAHILRQLDALTDSAKKFCPRCHGRVEPDDQFCFKCGARITR